MQAQTLLKVSTCRCNSLFSVIVLFSLSISMALLYYRAAQVKLSMLCMYKQWRDEDHEVINNKCKCQRQ